MALKSDSSRRGKTAGLALAFSNSLPNKPRGSKPGILTEHAEHDFHEEVGGPQGSNTTLIQPVRQLGEFRGGLDCNRLAGNTRLERIGVGEDFAEDFQIGRVRQSRQVEVMFFLSVPVKFVWTLNRSISQTTINGGFSRASR